MPRPLRSSSLVIRHFRFLPLFVLTSTLCAWPSIPTSQPAKPDYYALSDEDFFKLPALQNRFKETDTFSTVDRDLLEAAIFHATNLARIQQKLPPCKYNPALTPIARGHSDEMMQLQYFQHDSPVPANHTLTDRFKNAHLQPQAYAENIAMLPALDSPPVFDIITQGGVTKRINPETKQEILPYTYEAFAKAAVTAWMNSEHHRANILNPTLTTMAIGITAGLFAVPPDQKQDSILITQNFATDK